MSNIFLRNSSKVQPSGRFGKLSSDSPPKNERWTKQLDDSTDNSHTTKQWDKKDTIVGPPKTSRWGAIQNELEDEKEREQEREEDREERGNRFIKSDQNFNGNYHRRQTFNYKKKTKVEPPKLFDLEKEEEINSFPELG